MKKIASIACVVLLLFNVVGYYGLFFGLRYANDREMQEKLDADAFDTSETITIAVPIAIPYMVDSRNFERVDGKVEHNGESYRLLKQRFERDTLYLVCVKDVQDQRIDQALARFVKTFTDRPQDASHQTKIFATFIKDYVAQTFSIRTLALGWQQQRVDKIMVVATPADYHPSITHPPKSA
ncbi:hypothetical protein [Chryseolinea soli]|uniref:hypothetical protein n=1 Tax=Chryseolinea soli TaxID=2321403 RepID=UPI00135C91AF|nr:hypothetical protein [Chryseolinea soli]